MSVHTRSSSLTIDALPARSAPDASAAEVETRHLLAPVVIGVLSLVVMFAVAAAEGLPIRDPDARYVGSPLALIGVILLIFLALDLVPRTVRRARTEGVSARDAARALFLERWWGKRGVVVVACILGFYATYLSYRNLKSFLPFITDGQHDGGLAEFDRWLFFGNDPATLLHDLLGTGLSADILSASYLAFLTFVPVSLGIVLIWSSRVAVGVWYVTALALNWILGALSYYLIPSMGPIYAEPRLFADLPVTGTSELQQTLLEHRTEVINDPTATNAVQSIAAFASLHMAVVFTAALIAHLARAPRGLRIALWAYLGLTALSTIYFGWHYVSDDVAGLAIGAFAVFAAGMLAGIWRHPRDAFSRLKQPEEGAA